MKTTAPFVVLAILCQSCQLTEKEKIELVDVLEEKGFIRKPGAEEASAAQPGEVFLENYSEDTVFISVGEVIVNGGNYAAVDSPILLLPNSGKVDLLSLCDQDTSRHEQARGTDERTSTAMVDSKYDRRRVWGSFLRSVILVLLNALVNLSAP